MTDYTADSLLENMTRPSARLVEQIKAIQGDVMILGAGGKIGPSLAVTARRAFDAAGMKNRVYAASLFDYPDAAQSMRKWGVEVIEGDLGDAAFLSSLPDAPNVIHMTGRKFGTTGDTGPTWYCNVTLPAKALERYASSRFVVFSTGNVYGNAAVGEGGSREEDELRPVGEYAVTCVGRERLASFYSRKNGTPVLLFRLNYAIDLRYGVLYDIAKAVWEEKPVNVSANVFNCIWQGDVCEYAVRSLALAQTPPMALNVTSPESYSIRATAETFGRLLQKTPVFAGTEQPVSLHANAQKMVNLLGAPTVGMDEMMRRVADWLMNGGAAIAAPTHFESTDGKF